MTIIDQELSYAPKNFTIRFDQQGESIYIERFGGGIWTAEKCCCAFNVLLTNLLARVALWRPLSPTAHVADNKRLKKPQSNSTVEQPSTLA